MASPEKDKSTLRDNLLRRGISEDEINKVHRTLQEKGYGSEKAYERADAALQHLRAQRELEERRRATAPRAGAGTPAETGSSDTASEEEAARRAADGIHDVAPWLRRQINRYAYANGFLITRLRERYDDLMSIFNPARRDFVNRGLIRLLALQKGYQGNDPFRLSFIDNLNALRDSSYRLLGRRAPLLPGKEGQSALETQVLDALRAREPFALEFFGAFTAPQEALRTSLAYLAEGLRANARVPVRDLARIVKDGCRLIATTEAIEPDRLERLLDAVRGENIAQRPGPETSAELSAAEALFRAAFQNLRRFAHELYPALLKMIGAFYEESDASPEKGEEIRAFLGVVEGDVLSYDAWHRKAQELREKERSERAARELERLEHEKQERMSARFEGTLATLASLFPDSGIERLEQGHFVMPYYANRVFSRLEAWRTRLSDLERMSSADVMGPVLVLHTILDDFLRSLDPFALEQLLARDGVGASFTALRDAWLEAYPRLFDPYFDALREYERESEGDPRYAAVFRDSPRARAIGERVNRLRNHVIRDFGHTVGPRELYEGPELPALAARLTTLLAEASQVVNQDTIAAADPVRRLAAELLASRPVVDFAFRSPLSASDYRPVTRQVRRWIEARHRTSVAENPGKAQVSFLEVFRGVAELYDYLLNDPNSFAARSDPGVALASTADRVAWSRERDTRGREALESLQESLREAFPGQFTDTLTGLKNKDYFLVELPGQLERLRKLRKPLSFLLVDIDHFKWINDRLGHTRGDEVLRATTAMILDNIREGDVAVRYGGEEFLIVVPSDLHIGIILAERLRFAQDNRVLSRETMADVRKVGEAGGQPCGTLSIGVADVTGIPELEKSVDRVDKALYSAKRSRNAVIFIDRGGSFVTYAEYRRRTGEAAQ